MSKVIIGIRSPGMLERTGERERRRLPNITKPLKGKRKKGG